MPKHKGTKHTKTYDQGPPTDKPPRDGPVRLNTGPGAKLTQQQRMSLILDRQAGMANVKVAEKYGIRPESVSRIYRAFLRTEAPDTITANPENFRKVLKEQAITAVEAGLKCTVDQYRRGALGVNVLKGLGIFESEGVNVNVLNVPADWADRYEPIDVDSTVIEANGVNPVDTDT